jgi:hypothetical protein
MTSALEDLREAVEIEATNPEVPQIKIKLRPKHYRVLVDEIPRYRTTKEQKAYAWAYETLQVMQQHGIRWRSVEIMTRIGGELTRLEAHYNVGLLPRFGSVVR